MGRRDRLRCLAEMIQDVIDPPVPTPEPAKPRWRMIEGGRFQKANWIVARTGIGWTAEQLVEDSCGLPACPSRHVAG